MNGLERMLAVFQFEKPDRVPVFLNNTFSNATLIGKTVSAVCQSESLFTEALLTGYKTFGYDGIRVGADVTVEAEAMGCKVSFPEDGVPGVCKHIVEDEDDIDGLRMPDPYCDGRMPMILKATENCAREVGEEAFICSLVMGPVNIASQIMGVGNLLVMALEDPEVLEKLLKFTSEISFRFAKACVAAGAHGVVFGEAICSASMLGPAIYQDMIQRVHQNLIRELNINGIKYTTLHICGKLGDEQLKSIADTGAASLDVDAPVDMHHARTVLGKRLAFIGNVGTTDLIIKKPEEIEENCRQLLEPRDLGLVLAAGCTMGPATPKENVAAMVTAARKYGCFS